MKANVISLFKARERLYRQLYDISKQNAHMWASMTPEEFAGIFISETDCKLDKKQLIQLLQLTDNAAPYRYNPLNPTDFTDALL